MSHKGEKNLIVGLDLGTSKVAVVVGEIQAGGRVEIIGLGNCAAQGLRKGVVVNIEATVQAIQRAVEEAESMSGQRIQGVWCSISGNHISGFNSNGIVGIKDREVTQLDVDRVIDAARAVAIPIDQKILHILPQDFIIDGHDGVKEPIGMSGVRLETRVHMVTGAVSAAQNVNKCVRRCGLEVDYLVLEPLAASYAVLHEEEKAHGVCLVNIGAGTTDVAVFVDGAIHHTAVFPIAGDQVTNDISVALRTPTPNAEALKIKYACALCQLVAGDQHIEVPSIGNRPARRLARQVLAEVVEPRYEELLTLVHTELAGLQLEQTLAGGIVLTGGGAKMEGLVELAEKLFKLPVRLGVPQYVGGLHDVIGDPIYATGVGLLLFGQRNRFNSASQHGETDRVPAILTQFRRWFQHNF